MAIAKGTKITTVFSHLLIKPDFVALDYQHLLLSHSNSVKFPCMQVPLGLEAMNYYYEVLLQALLK